jgi:GNAT superfamily N-acetyltransferase
MISLASPEDAARASALLSASSNDQLNTVSGIRYRIESAQPDDQLQYWRAESDGELVGWAYAGLDAFAAVRTVGFAGIVVHPAHRREGTGAALWDVVSTHLDEIGARRIVSYSRGDDDTIAFVRARAFKLEATDTSSEVDPRTLGTPPAAAPGLELRPMRAFDDDPEPIFMADLESAADEPGPSDFSGMTYETWRRLTWDHPDFDRELSAAVLADGIVVGTTFLYSDRERGRAANGGTGVMRDFRGRGLGLLMKQHSLAWAAAAGITRVTTQNDDTNAPMLAINARLGYRPCDIGHAWVLER